MNIANKIILTTIIGLIVFTVSHLIITRPQDIKRYVYPLEAKIASTKFTCSQGSPQGLTELLDFGWQQGGSLSNQVAYRDSSGTLFHCEGGWADHLLGQPVNQAHRYRYASITKLVTADLILRLIDEKRLSFDTRLPDVFPDINPVNDIRVNDITITHLLNHSAGFNRLTPEGDAMFFSAKKNWCPFNLQQLSKENLNFTPGEKQIYSNLGYCLLGAVIEKVTGVSYRDYAEKVYGLDGLGIKFVDGVYLADEVKYDFRFDPMYGDNYHKKYDLKAASAAVGLSGSATALVRLMENILSRPGLSLLDTPDLNLCQKNKKDKCYGFAFVYNQQRDSSVFYMHDGYLPGSTSLIVVGADGGIFVMLNAGRAENQDKMEKKLHKIVADFLKRQSELK